MDAKRLQEVARRVGITPAEVVALSILLAGSLALTGVVWWQGRPVEAGATAPVAITEGATADMDVVPTDQGTVIVDVTGLVASPGLVELPTGARVADAVDAAGGVVGAADTTSLNLARVLNDGEQVVVRDGSTPTASAGDPADEGLLPDGRVDLNRATTEQLQQLPGVGPVTADRIVAHRDTLGGFTDVIQLLEVPGIGPTRFDALEPLVGL